MTTYRPDYRPPWLAKSYATQLALPRLRPQDSRTVVQSVLPTAPDAGPWEQARAALSTATDLYRAMEMTFWLPQAETALAQVEGRCSVRSIGKG